MSSGLTKKTRSEHVAAKRRPRPRGLSAAALAQPKTQVRLGLCLLAAVLMVLCTGGWRPPFPYQAGYTPQRDLVARVDFKMLDEAKTAEARQAARLREMCVYRNEPQLIRNLERDLDNALSKILRADAASAVSEDVWKDFRGERPEDAPPDFEEQSRFLAFRQALAEVDDFAAIKQAIAQALRPVERKGVLENPPPPSLSTRESIDVHPPGEPETRETAAIDEALATAVRRTLPERLDAELSGVISDQAKRQVVVAHLAAYLQKNLPVTLTLNEEATAAAQQAAADAVENVFRTYYRRNPLTRVSGGDVLAEGGEPLTADSQVMKLLRKEHEAYLTQMSLTEKALRALADFGMYIALYTLCGLYIFFREPRLIDDFRSFATLLALAVAAALCGFFAATEMLRMELVPILLFALIVRIAYGHELSLLLTAAISLATVLSLGRGLESFVILVATGTTAIQLLGDLRTRTKLVYVGGVAAAVSIATTLGVGTMVGQPLVATLLPLALWNGACAIMAAVLLSGILPFVEWLFDVQTELSLLELGDATHPLLQELVRRAPGTYNHSINVASLGEAAADAIGANGLLVRVGAYFHDVGKMLKPEYFIENQNRRENRHDTLLPAMSTLVIIAHVKDGADLARQYGLPQSIIDFIMQHHGTTLVEFFYNQAHQRRRLNPDSGDVDEVSFRYPGPKPQTRESAVLMLADSVESASRTLTDPAPSRIESLVNDIAMNKLMDGQFDESGLTLTELKIVRQQLAMSLTAIYHGRVKYPEKKLETATPKLSAV